MNFLKKYYLFCDWLYANFSLLEQINAHHIFLISFMLCVIFIFLKMPNNILVGDEVFYYFQAKALLNLNFIWFENTQPYIYPLILTPLVFTFSNSLIFIRLFSALLIALSSVMLYLFSNKLFGKKIAVICSILFLFHPQTIKFGSEILTEPLFVFLGLASFYIFYSFKNNSSPRRIFSLGLVSGLAFLTRLSGAFLLVIFPLITFFRQNKLFRDSIFSSIIALFLFSSFFFFGGFKIIYEKLSLGLFSAEFYDYAFWNSMVFFGLFFLMLIFSSFFSKINLRNGQKQLFFEMKFSFLLYIVLVFLASSFLIARYFFFAFPFATIISAVSIVQAPKKDRRVFVFLLLSYLLFNIFSFYSLSPDVSNQYYLSRENCVNVDSLSYFDENDLITKKLPIFDQPSDSNVEYFYSFNLDSEYGGIFMSYLSDNYQLFIDNQHISNGDSLFLPQRIPYYFSSGKHELKLIIYNSYNIGGIGQILICK